jgi:phosphoglycerate dehydrogenase-like enzyme
LAARPNVVVTPHAAGYYNGLGAAVGEEVVATVRGWLTEGRLPHEVVSDSPRTER